MKVNKNFANGLIIAIALMTIIGLSGLTYFTPKPVNNYPEESAGDSSSQPTSTEPQSPAMEPIDLVTKDNIKIKASLYPVKDSPGWVVFSHMMPATKESWDRLAGAFASAGLESIAIDLRGHGESEGGPNGYENFSDAEHQKSIADIDAAVNYLFERRLAPKGRIFLIGASIGANLSLEYLSEHPELKVAILLSPGLDYRGIKTEPLVKNLAAGQKVFFVSSHDDIRSGGGSNADQNEKLYNLVPEGVIKEIKIFNTAGHGTAMLEAEPTLGQLIYDFLQKNAGQ